MATTTDTLIFEFKVKDDASRVFDAWERKLHQLEKDIKRTFKALFDSLGSVIFTGLINAATTAADIIGKTLKGAFDAVADVTKDAVKDSIALEDAMSGVRRTANLTDDQMVELTKRVRDLSSEELRGAVSAQELGEILEVAGQRGELAGERFEETLEKALQFTEEIALASTALDLSMQKTADALGKIQSPFGDATASVGQLGNAVNVLADTTKAAAPSTIDMAKRMAPALASLGLSQGDLLGLAGAMDALGVSSYTGATALQQAFKKMTSETTKFATVFKVDAAELNRLVQTDIGGAFELVLQAVQRMATETPDGVQRVSQALKDLQISEAGVSTAILGLAGLGPKLQRDFLDPAAQGLTNMDSINAEFINSISRVSQLWEALGTIWKNTTGAISDALLPVFKQLLNEINKQAIAFRKWFVNSEFVSTTLPAAMEALRDILSKLVTQAADFIRTLDWATITTQAQSFFTKLVNWIDTVDMKQVFATAQEAAKGFFRFVTDTLPVLVQSFETFLKIVDTIAPTIGPIFATLEKGATLANSVISSLVEGIKELGDLTETVFGGLGKALATTGEAMSEVTGKIQGVIQGVLNLGREAFGQSVFPEMTQWANRTSAAVEGIGGAALGVTSSLQTVQRSLQQAQHLSRGVLDTQRIMTTGETLSHTAFRQRQQRMQTRLAPPPVAVQAPRQEPVHRYGGKSERQAPTSMKGGPVQPTRMKGAVQQITNINFTGQNVLDESSKNRFARKITQRQTYQKSHVIRG